MNTFIYADLTVCQLHTLMISPVFSLPEVRSTPALCTDFQLYIYTLH